jgi:hypothetical protein
LNVILKVCHKVDRTQFADLRRNVTTVSPMWLLLVTALAIVTIVLVTRGSFKGLTRIKIDAAGLLAIGLGIQVALEFIDIPADSIETVGYGLLMASYAFILAFCIANLRHRGFGVIAVGIGMNALVIGLNQGMPTRPIGSDAHGNRVYKPVVQTVKHRQERNDDLLGVLGDKILFPKPFNTLVSAGDLVLAVGICELAYFESRRSKGPRMVKQSANRGA